MVSHPVAVPSMQMATVLFTGTLSSNKYIIELDDKVSGQSIRVARPIA